jgi:hypothetical protein
MASVRTYVAGNSLDNKKAWQMLIEGRSLAGRTRNFNRRQKLTTIPNFLWTNLPASESIGIVGYASPDRTLSVH